MADHGDFPNIYIDGVTGGVGSLADPYTDLSDINWTTGGDNSIFDYLDTTPSASPTIHLDMDTEFREALTVNCDGTVAYPIVIKQYDSGGGSLAPIVNGSDVVSTWTETGGTDFTVHANLLGLWYMEEESGTRLDETANDIDLTDNNTVTRTATHQQGTYAAEFVAANNETLSAADGTLPATFPGKDGGDDASWTAGAWVYPLTDITDVGIMGKQYKLHIGINASEKFEIRTQDSLNATKTSTANTSATTGSWYHVVGRFTLGGDLEIFINGVDDSAAAPTVTDQSDSSQIFQIGGSLSEAADMEGYIDEAFVFDAAMSDADIKAIHDDRLDGSAGGGVADVWQATLTTEPNQVFFDGTRGTVQASAVACDAEFDWFWEANVLYIYSAGGDPDTEYTEIEASTRLRCVFIDNKDYITLEDLHFKNSNADSIGIDSGSSNITVDGITSEYAYWRGIQNSSAGDTNTDNTFKNSTITYSGGNGIWNGSNTDTTLVQSNTIHHNCQLAIDESQHVFTGGIKANGSTCVGLIVEYNTVYSEGDGNTGDRGAGIWTDTDVQAPITRYNKSYDNQFHGIYVELTSDAEVYYNLVWDNDNDGIILRGGDTDCNRNEVYNNVVYSNTGSGISVWGDNSTADCIDDNLIRNNIVIGNTHSGTGKSELRCFWGGENDGTVGSGNVYEYNCFGAEQDYFIFWDDGDLDTYDLFETAYGGSSNSVESDPLMVDPGNDLFALQVTSPCIDTGTDVSLTTDFPGRTVGGSPDMGAYEFLSIAADTDAYAETGTAASTLFNRLVTAATDSYTVTGADVTLTFTETSHGPGNLVMGMGMELK